jgi:cephalosporin hydroxylase
MSDKSGIVCPLCSGPTDTSLIRLQDFPAIQNRLYESAVTALAAPRYAADYRYCARCVHAFDPNFAAREEPEWEHYDNDQLASSSYRAHIEEVVATLAKSVALDERSMVLEPACGSGYLLAQLAARTGARILGYDPQYKGTFGLQAAVRKELFRAPSAEPADLIILRHAIEAVTDVDELLAAVVGSLSSSGVLYLEITDLDALVRRGDSTLFSCEYGRYYSLRALDRCLGRHGLLISEARSCFGGDYLAVFARRMPEAQPLGATLDRVEAELARRGKVVLWGSAGRGISALLQRGWDTTRVAFCADVDPGKQGKYIPITGQRILSPQEVRSFAPDLVLVSNSRYLQEIRSELPPGTPIMTLDGRLHDSGPVRTSILATDDAAQFEREVAARVAANAQDVPLIEASQRWLHEADRAGYEYNFRWLGMPIIQYPGDIVAMQELVWSVRPEVIVETGVARGGGTVFYASMLALLGGERQVIGVDIDLRPHNRARLSAHPMAPRITLVSGSSIDAQVVAEVYARCRGRHPVMVCLDANHSHEHVLAELRAYAPLVGKDSYLIVFDTSIESLEPSPRSSRPWSRGNSPATAVAAFLGENDRFVVDHAMTSKLMISSNPGGYLRCVRDEEET